MGGHQRSRAARARGLRSRAEREKRTGGLLVCEGCVERPDPSSWDRGRPRGWYRRREVAGPMKWVQRRRAVTVRRAGRLVLCTIASLAFGEYAGSSSTAGRARQVFCRSLCRPVRVSPTRGTRPVLASPAPPPRCRSITLVRRNDPTGEWSRVSRERARRRRSPRGREFLSSVLDHLFGWREVNPPRRAAPIFGRSELHQNSRTPRRLARLPIV